MFRAKLGIYMVNGMKNTLHDYLNHICGADNVWADFPMSRRTSFKIGGTVRFYVTVQAREALVRLLSGLDQIGEPYQIVGAGANLLARDEYYDGVVIRPGFNEIVRNGEFVYADAGVGLGVLCAWSRRESLTGFEWLAGIPGTVGGALFMNAGAYDGDMGSRCVCVDVLMRAEDAAVLCGYADSDDDGWVVVNMPRAQLEFGYRDSRFMRNRDWVILGGYFRLQVGDKIEICRKIREIVQKRGKSLPQQPNGGSAFCRPRPDFYVGTTIDRLGLKGKSIGGAQISEKHAGVIVNTGGATCADVLGLIDEIKSAVHADTGETLRMEYEMFPHVHSAVSSEISST